MPVGLVVRGPEGELHGLRQGCLRLGEEVEALVAVGVLEGPVAPVVLDRDERLERVARRREERQVALGGERSARGVGIVLVDGVAYDEVERARGGEIAELDEVGPLEPFETLDGLGNQEMKIGVTLPVGVAAEVDGEAVDEERDVGAVIGVEPAQEVLLGLAAALMLADHEAGNESQDVGRPPLGAKLEVAPGNEDLGRCRDRRRGRHHDGR